MLKKKYVSMHNNSNYCAFVTFYNTIYQTAFVVQSKYYSKSYIAKMKKNADFNIIQVGKIKTSPLHDTLHRPS